MKDQEITDKINENLLPSKTSFSEQLSNNVPSADDSPKSSVKDLPIEEIISTTSDNMSIVKNSHDVNSVDR